MSEKQVHRSLRPLLMKLGLDEKQVEIYLALLSLKSAKASEIAKTAKQSRSHTYLILRELGEMGLVSEVEESNILRFIAEPPERLLSYLREKEEEYKGLQGLMKGALPLLHSLSSDYLSAPRVTVMKGLDGMKQVYRDVLVHPFVGIFNPQKSEDMFGQNLVTMLFGKSAELKGRDLVVNNEGGRKYCEEIIVNEEYQIRLLPEGVHFDTDTMVYQDNVILFAFDDDKTVIRIENKKIADTFRAWFEILWGISMDPKTP